MFATFWNVTASLWMIRPTCCAKTYTTDCRPTPRNIVEDRKPQSRDCFEKKESMAMFTKFRNTRHVEAFSEISSGIMKEEALPSRESFPHVATTHYRNPAASHMNVVCFLLGNSPMFEFYMPTFRNMS